jgi:hypothetical protein
MSRMYTTDINNGTFDLLEAIVRGRCTGMIVRRNNEGLVTNVTVHCDRLLDLRNIKRDLRLMNLLA